MDTSFSDKRIYLQKDPDERIYIMHPTEIYLLGYQLVPRIQKVLNIDGDHSIDYVLGQIAAGNMPVILFEKHDKIEFFIVCSINSYSLKRVLTLFLAEGKNLVSHWCQKMPLIEMFARQIKCDAVEVIGRKGQLKIYEGFKQTDIVLRKNL